MNLHSNLSLHFAAYWLYNLILKGLIDLFFIIIHRDVWCLQMFHVPKHLEWVVKSHQEVVQLIWPLVIAHDHVEDVREQGPDPVYETASS